ncbi:hypothetical protein AMECASPLE_038803 [Ameca splendens]|uniref:Uncharacterized protein n=1 Tax=Ameca splendens TaxID=208324 RepID=A0ABV1AEP7_9TELE
MDKISIESPCQNAALESRTRLPLIRDQVAGAADSAETPRRPSPQTPPPGEAQDVPRQAERHSPSSMSWAVPWASYQWDVPGTPPEEGVQEASSIDAQATSTGSSRCGGAAALLRAPPGWPESGQSSPGGGS